MRPEDALARLPVPARRLAYRAAHRVLNIWWLVRRPPAEGVKCVLRHEGRILFVRHTYGDRGLWELPGGGMGRGEPPLDAARREASEELGVDLQWRWLGAVQLHERKMTLLRVYVADAASEVVSPDPGELAEVRWATPGSPPRPLSASSRAILELI